MADNFRSRSQQFARVSDQVQELPPEEDPLAELARLIGQDQAFIAASREAREARGSEGNAPPLHPGKPRGGGASRIRGERSALAGAWGGGRTAGGRQSGEGEPRAARA